MCTTTLYLFWSSNRCHVFVRSETRDANGRVVGSYQYLDPLKRIVKVDYTADSSGFYPTVQGAVPDALPKVRQGEGGGEGEKRDRLLPHRARGSRARRPSQGKTGRGREGEGPASIPPCRESCPTLCPR